MAQKVQVTLIDDIDGESVATGTRVFSVDGVKYEIDLTDKHQAEFDKAISKYVDAGRKVAVAGRKAVGTSRAAAAGRRPSKDIKAIRDWANANGFTVPERGRLSAAVHEAYEAAHAS